MKVLLVQLKVARIGQPVLDRIATIETLINAELGKMKNSKVHLIVLPETAFCSYCQPSASAALTVAVEQEPIIKDWAKKFASLLNCYLVFGYIGRDETKTKARNALAVFAPSGELCHDTTKRFLYDSDLVWTSLRGADFEVVELKEIAGSPRVLFAICNDINAADFSEEEMQKRPLAATALEKKAQIVVLSAAWCSAHPDSPSWAHDEEISEQSQINYWLERLQPLWGRGVFFCCADLVGREKIPNKGNVKIKYCGSSCGIALKDRKLLRPALSTWKETAILIDLPL